MDAVPVVVREAEIRRELLIKGRHEGSGDVGVEQPQRVAELMRRRHEQAVGHVLFGLEMRHEFFSVVEVHVAPYASPRIKGVREGAALTVELVAVAVVSCFEADDDIHVFGVFVDLLKDEGRLALPDVHGRRQLLSDDPFRKISPAAGPPERPSEGLFVPFSPLRVVPFNSLTPRPIENIGIIGDATEPDSRNSRGGVSRRALRRGTLRCQRARFCRRQVRLIGRTQIFSHCRIGNTAGEIPVFAEGERGVGSNVVSCRGRRHKGGQDEQQSLCQIRIVSPRHLGRGIVQLWP